MASVPPIQELTDLINNLDKYLENVDENTSLPPKEVQDRARNMLTKLNRLLFIFNQVAIRSHDGTAIYSVDQLLHNIKWGGEGYGIAFADPQFKIARFFIATRWENTVKKRKAK
ncbi:hypothetical protein IWW43_001698 [Coemansia sp. RSA 1935]|nr:hypothetical protein IWW43_001698 [Coemansia sp. RSA 1935]